MIGRRWSREETVECSERKKRRWRQSHVEGKNAFNIKEDYYHFYAVLFILGLDDLPKTFPPALTTAPDKNLAIPINKSKVLTIVKSIQHFNCYNFNIHNNMKLINYDNVTSIVKLKLEEKFLIKIYPSFDNK